MVLAVAEHIGATLGRFGGKSCAGDSLTRRGGVPLPGTWQALSATAAKAPPVASTCRRQTAARLVNTTDII